MGIKNSLVIGTKSVPDPNTGSTFLIKGGFSVQNPDVNMVKIPILLLRSPPDLHNTPE